MNICDKQPSKYLEDFINKLKKRIKMISSLFHKILEDIVLPVLNCSLFRVIC